MYSSCLKLLIFVVSLFPLSCKSQDTLKLYPNYEMRQIPCDNYLKSIKVYWSKDSIGENGFRLFVLDNIIGNCNPIGKKWSDFSKYLGEPNKTEENENYFLFEFDLTHHTLDFTKYVLIVYVDKKAMQINDFRQRVYDM